MRVNDRTGLQTPRLKRLAEIVSAQAIAQQEKMESFQDEGANGDDLQHEQENLHESGLMIDGVGA